MTLRHKDPTLRHNNPSLRHKDPTLRHNDAALLHNAAAGATPLVAVSTQSVAGVVDIVTTTHALDGGGSGRTVIAFLSSSAGGSRTLNSVTLNGVAGTIIYANQFGTASDDVVNTGIAYWLDADHPGEGSFDVVFNYDNGVRRPIVTVVEMQDTDQSVVPDAKGLDGVEDVSPNALAMSVQTSATAGGQVDEVMLTVLSVWNGVTWEAGVAFASDNVDQELVEEFNVNSAQALWYDAKIASDPITYSLTGSGSDVVAEAYRARSVVVHRA